MTMLDDLIYTYPAPEPDEELFAFWDTLADAEFPPDTLEWWEEQGYEPDSF